jgi:hypothetical protein
VSASATPTLPTGSTLNKMSLTPAHDTVVTLGSVGKLVDADCSNSVLYAVKRSDIANPTTGGLIYAVLLSNLSYALVSEVAACRAVAVGIPPTGTPVIFVTAKIGAQESLRIYTENGLDPVLQTTHKLPTASNAISVVMTSATEGTVMVSMVDRLNVYELNGLTSPLRMRMSIPVLNLGQFLQTRLAPNGNIVAAMGNAGVGVFSPVGEMVSQILPSEIIAPYWKVKSYALNDLVRPSINAPLRALRLFYKCTTAGASGTNEPKWASTGTTTDGSAVWTVQGSTDTYVTSILLDTNRKRIYAAGVLGGSTGTQGRVFSISAKTLLGG